MSTDNSSDYFISLNHNNNNDNDNNNNNYKNNKQK